MSFRNTRGYQATLVLSAIVTGVFAWNYIAPFTDDLPTYQGRTMTFVYTCANKPPGFGLPKDRPMPSSPADPEPAEASPMPATELTSARGR